MEFRRKIYTRGSSYETTIPMPLLLTLDTEKKHDAVFSYDPEKQLWTIHFEERTEEKEATLQSSTNSRKKYTNAEKKHQYIAEDTK